MSVEKKAIELNWAGLTQNKNLRAILSECNEQFFFTLNKNKKLMFVESAFEMDQRLIVLKLTKD